MKTVAKRCNGCKHYIYIDREEFLQKGKSFYHYQCYVDHINNSKKTEKAKIKLLVEAEKLREKAKELAIEISTKQKITTYISNVYNEPFLPQALRDKLEDIYDGIYEGLSEPVSPNVLLDMWQRKFDELQKINEWNVRHGKHIEGLGRIHYDLAILLRKYGEYKKWLEKQKILAIQNAVENQPSLIDFVSINKTVDANLHDRTDVDDFSIYADEI